MRQSGRKCRALLLAFTRYASVIPENSDDDDGVFSSTSTMYDYTKYSSQRVLIFNESFASKHWSLVAQLLHSEVVVGMECL